MPVHRKAFVGAEVASVAGPRVTLGTAAFAGAAVSTLLLLAIGATAVLYRYPPSLAAALLGGVALLGVLALALARYDLAVALGFLLIGVVRIEPAPPDAVFSIVIAVAVVTGRFRLDRVPLLAGGVVGLFLVLNLLSAVEAVDPRRAALFLSITLYLAVFGLWLTGYVDSERHVRIVLRAYLAAALISAAIGLLALFFPIPGRELFLSFGCCRAQALFADPNVFGPFLVPAALFLIEEMLKPRLLAIRNSVAVTMLLLLVLGVLFSYSRAAWLNLGVGLVVLLVVLSLRRGGGKRALAAVAVLMSAGTVAVAVTAATGSIGFLEQRAAFQQYDVERFGAQRTGIDLAGQHPFGIGPGQFEVVLPIASHSLYVRTLAEQGLLGLVAMLVLMIVTLIYAARNIVLGRDTYGLGSAALFAAWCGILANSFFVDTLHWRHLWMVAALIWVGAMRRDLPGRLSSAR